MDETPPTGFVPLEKVPDHLKKDVDIIGVVTDFLPPSRTKGTDFQSTFSLTDWSNYTDCALGIKFFRPKEEQLPTIRGTGDVILLRRMKVSQWNGMTSVLSSHWSEWIVFPASTLPPEAPQKIPKLQYLCAPRTKPPRPSEWLYAISICNSQDRSAFTAPTDPTAALAKTAPSTQYLDAAPTRGKREFALVKDVETPTFYDLVGEVIKIHGTSAGRVELYLTDYTSNPFLYNYEWGRPGFDDEGRDGDTFNYVRRKSGQKWPGPFGKMTIQITLWPPHSLFALNGVKLEDFVWLRNVRIKFDKDQTRLEGTMFNDSKFPDRLDIGILKDSDDRVKEAMARKEAYWKRAKAEGIKFIDDVRGEKRKKGQEEDAQPKGRGKRRKKQLQREEDQRVLELAQIKKLEKHETNRNIRSAHPAVLPQPISEILNSNRRQVNTPGGIKYQLPFHNICCRASVRVVDYFPRKLEDFAVPSEPSEPSDDAEYFDNQDYDSQTRPSGWEWRFYLLVEDGAVTKGNSNDEKKARLKVLVTNQDAVYLLKIDAEDLRKNHTRLDDLRERLFILWGDLEERKSAASKALKARDPNKNQGHQAEKVAEATAKTKQQQQPCGKPFECCLKEYGIRIPHNETLNLNNNEVETKTNTTDGKIWERRFMMFGTTIL
ncbi:MAG: hypothetical protein M1812_005398 [Candelaria pacifica]|nr:MAG: hypothetical protein M1812_005398 [Candelaria pacifica]